MRVYVDDPGQVSPEAIIELGSLRQWQVALTLSDGTHTVSADAVDDLGQESADATAGTITIDTQAPTASIVALPAYQDQSTFTVEWSGQDPAPSSGLIYDLEHRLESSGWDVLLAGTDLTQWSYTAAEGAHSFRVRARDGAGWTSAYAATSTLVDNTDPVVTLVDIDDSAPNVYASGNSNSRFDCEERASSDASGACKT